VTEFLFSKLVQWIVFPVLAISLIIGINLPFFNFEFFSIMFAFLIVNLAANKKVIFSLENKLWHYLGKISFGLYMYHFIAITLTRQFVNHFPFISHWVQFSLMLGLTVLMAACSYHFYEKFFIRRKIRYANNIITGDNIAGRASGFFMHMPDKKRPVMFYN
jgi:peptidoglycan/LPS O-acetylase OafA/YrhL